MKYLNDYQENAQTRLFNKTGAFFAFSTKQFDEAMAIFRDPDNPWYETTEGGIRPFDNNRLATLVAALKEKIDNKKISKDLVKAMVNEGFITVDGVKYSLTLEQQTEILKKI